MHHRLNHILFCVGIVAIVVMLFSFDVSFTELWYHIRRAGYWLLAAILLWAIVYAMNAQAWRIIIRGSGECPVSFWQMWRLTVAGYALNTTVPVGGIGGEPYRIMEMSRYIGTERATSSVVLFAMMHVFSHFWFWLSGIVVWLLMAAFGVVGITSLAGWLLVFTAFISCGGIFLFTKGYRHGLVLQAIRLLGRVPGLRGWGKRFECRHRDSLAKVDSQIAALWHQSRSSFYGSLLMEYFGRWVQCLEVFFILIMLNRPASVLTFLFAFLILAFTSLFANIVGFIPLQLGGREGGFALSVGLLGISPDVGLSVSLVCRVREIVWSIAGLIIMKLK